MASTYGFTLKMRGVFAACALAGGIFAVADCGSASDNASGFAGDAAVGEDSGEGGPGDAAFVESGAPIAVTLAVHASPDLFDFRVCFGGSSSVDGASVTFLPGVAPWPNDDAHPMAMANYAGIAVGSGVALPRDILPTGHAYVVPYVIKASRLATDAHPTHACEARVGPNCIGAECIATTEAYALPAISSSSFINGAHAQVLAFVGCTTPGSPACGTAMNGALHTATLPLANDVQLATDQMSVQLAHVAPAVGPVTATFDAVLNDAGPVAARYLDVGPPLGAIVNCPTDPPSPLWGTQKVSVTAGGDAGIALTMSLADVQRVSNPSLLPSDLFKPGKSYVFLLVGDPNATNALYVDGGLNPKFDGIGLHIIAVATAPPPPGDGG